MTVGADIILPKANNQPQFRRDSPRGCPLKKAGRLALKPPQHCRLFSARCGHHALHRFCSAYRSGNLRSPVKSANIICFLCNTFPIAHIRCDCKRQINRLTGNGGQDIWVADAITTGAFSSSSFFFSATTIAVQAAVAVTQEAMIAAADAVAK